MTCCAANGSLGNLLDPVAGTASIALGKLIKVPVPRRSDSSLWSTINNRVPQSIVVVCRPATTKVPRGPPNAKGILSTFGASKGTFANQDDVRHPLAVTLEAVAITASISVRNSTVGRISLRFCSCRPRRGTPSAPQLPRADGFRRILPLMRANFFGQARKFWGSLGNDWRVCGE